MPIYPPRNEPIKKIEILEKRIVELQKEILINSSRIKIDNKSEKVRSAKLNLIKARLSLLKPYRGKDETDLNQALVRKLKEEYTKWESLAITEIINEVCD